MTGMKVKPGKRKKKPKKKPEPGWGMLKKTLRKGVGAGWDDDRLLPAYDW